MAASYAEQKTMNCFFIYLFLFIQHESTKQDTEVIHSSSTLILTSPLKKDNWQEQINDNIKTNSSQLFTYKSGYKIVAKRFVCTIYDWVNCKILQFVECDRKDEPLNSRWIWADSDELLKSRVLPSRFCRLPKKSILYCWLIYCWIVAHFRHTTCTKVKANIQLRGNDKSHAQLKQYK